MPPKRPPKGGKAYQLAKPLPLGEVMTDILKKRWVLGPPIGQGGFGLIYLAAPESEKRAEDKNAHYVIKLEPHENGPLFTELAFYLRVAKKEKIDEWKALHRGVSFLGIPEYIGSGNHTNSSTQYRFMVMQRFGKDLEKIFTECGRQFSMPTVCYLALRVLDALEYLHDQGYVHADIKASNLLTGLKNKHEVYLVDYGLAMHYTYDGRHRVYKEDPRKAHNGTVEFTSRDAHSGVDPSRRGDLEILGYCLLQWAGGRLPWEDKLTDKEKVAREKREYMKNPLSLVKACVPVQTPKCLVSYLEHINVLTYDEKPNYALLQQLFHKELTKMKCSDKSDVLDWVLGKAKAVKRPATDDVDIDELPIQKKKTPPRGKRKAQQPKVKPVVSQPISESDEDEPKLPSPRTPPRELPVQKKTPPRGKRKAQQPKVKPVVSQPISESDEDEPKLPSPRTPPRATIKKTAQPTKRKASPIRRSPRARKMTQSEILAEKIRIGANIIPGAVTVKPRTNTKKKR